MREVAKVIFDASDSSPPPNHFATTIFFPELVGSKPKPNTTRPITMAGNEFVKAPIVMISYPRETRPQAMYKAKIIPN